MTRKAILLDFGGTLDADGVHWSTRFFRAFRERGVLIDRERLDRAFFVSERGLAARPDIGELSLDAYVETQVALIAEALGLDEVPVARISQSFLAPMRAQLERSRALLTSRKQSSRFGLVSNFYANLPKIVGEVGLDACFEALSISALLGVAKPELRIFEHALATLGAAPHDAVMIGDSLKNDIMPAKALGMLTVWIRGDEALGGGEPSAADHVVRTLEEGFVVIDARPK